MNRFSIIAPLMGFKHPVEVFSFANGVTFRQAGNDLKHLLGAPELKHISDHKQQVICGEPQLVLEIEYRAKDIWDDEDERPLYKNRTEIRRAALILWLTQYASPYIKHYFDFYIGEDGKRKIISEGPEFKQIHFFTDDYKIPKKWKDKDRIVELSKRALKLPENHVVRLAMETLYVGLAEDNPHLRLLILTIVLESLFGTDNQELRFQLSNRVAFFLGNLKDDPDHSDDLPEELATTKNLFYTGRKIYDLRSQIAHGEQSKLKKEDLRNLETIIRLSLLKLLDDPDLLKIFGKKEERGKYLREVHFPNEEDDE